MVYCLEAVTEMNSIVGFRNRALICVMVYTFARVGTIITMRVVDYDQNANAGAFSCTRKAGNAMRSPPTTKPKPW